MNLDYVTRLMYEDLTVFEFLEHCTGVFREKINNKVVIRERPLTQDNAFTNNVEIERSRLTLLCDELDELSFMNEEQKEAYGSKLRDAEISGYNHSIEDGLVLRKKLIDMENQVSRWDAPSAELELIKEFVIKQVRDAIISHNEDIAHYEAELKICQTRTPLDYHKRAVYQAKSGIEYCEKAINERTNS